jgi:TonB family protein
MIVICYAFGLLLCSDWVRASDKILIQIHLFQGIWTEGQPGLKQIEVLTTSSRPELSSLKEKAASSERELTVAAIDTLLDLYDLQAVEDLFLHEKWWDGRKLRDVQWDGRIRPEEALEREHRPMYDMIGGQASYRINLSPKSLPSQLIALHAIIYKSKKFRDEVIVDQELVLEVGDPVIVAVPYEGRAHFMMVLLTVGDPGAKRPEPEKDKKPRTIRFFAAPKAIIQVQPSYPEELRRRLVGGEIGLRITVDEKGVVQRIDVEKPLYPYLDYSAVQAFRQWTFEPVRIGGKPVPAAFRFTYSFYPRVSVQENPQSEKPPAGSDSSSQEELSKVLAGSGDYCQKLTGAVLDFICEETIKETHYDLLNNIIWMDIRVGKPGSRSSEDEINKSQINNDLVSDDLAKKAWQREYDPGRIVGRLQIMDPKLTKRNNFLCDYLIIKKAGAIEERRIILKENGRKIADRNKLLEEKRFSGLSSLLAPLRVLAKDRQSRFNFRIVDEEGVHGNKAYVIEALPRSEDEDGIWSARIWVDKKSFQILKCEIEGVPIDGYEDVLKDCVIVNIKPIFIMTHEYRAEKNGVLFPSRSKVHAAYPGIDYRGPIEKVTISLAYDKYKFFTVETEPRIIK